MKNIYDITCVLLAVILGMAILGKPRGFGGATVASALLVGRCVRWIRAGMCYFKRE